jgi:hypothetical protein
MQRLVQVFFVSPKYLQDGEAPIFQSFRFVHTQKDCRRLLEEEFKPTFLCGPDFHKYGPVTYGHAYLVFSKLDEGYWRMIRSETVGGFYSSGGGKSNILNLIYAMLDLKLWWTTVHMYNVKQKEWEELAYRRWYNKGMHVYNGGINIEAQDIFERWYNEAYEWRSKHPGI